MSRSNYQEKSVLHRQYRIDVPAGDSYVVLTNPFAGWPGLIDALDPTGDRLEFFPAKAGVFEIDPGILYDEQEEQPLQVGRFFLCRYVDDAVDTEQAIDWTDDDSFVCYFKDIQNICVMNLTIWLPLKCADTRFYNYEATPDVVL